MIDVLLTDDHALVRTGIRRLLEDSGEVKIYYGAADTVEALALADVGDLLDLCKPV